MLCSERTHSAHTAHTSCSDRQLSLRHRISAKDTFSWEERITLLEKMLDDLEEFTLAFSMLFFARQLQLYILEFDILHLD